MHGPATRPGTRPDSHPPIPGTWYSQGRATYCSPEEARAFANLYEWAGTQPWSNGRVGLSGVSYLTTS